MRAFAVATALVSVALGTWWAVQPCGPIDRSCLARVHVPNLTKLTTTIAAIEDGRSLRIAGVSLEAQQDRLPARPPIVQPDRAGGRALPSCVAVDACVEGGDTGGIISLGALTVRIIIGRCLAAAVAAQVWQSAEYHCRHG